MILRILDYRSIQRRAVKRKPNTPEIAVKFKRLPIAVHIIVISKSADIHPIAFIICIFKFDKAVFDRLNIFFAFGRKADSEASVFKHTSAVLKAYSILFFGSVNIFNVLLIIFAAADIKIFRCHFCIVNKRIINRNPRSILSFIPHNRINNRTLNGVAQFFGRRIFFL